MKFNILYYTFSSIKAIALFALCLSLSSIKAQSTCGNNAGAPMPDILVCAGDIAYGNSVGLSLASNSVVQFYLHNYDINNPIDSNQTGIFFNNLNYPLNTDLLITAAVGPPTLSGTPNLTDICTAIQETGTKVVFLDEITITSDYDCMGTDAQINYIVNGGLPAYNNSPYSISGDNVNTVSENTNNLFVSLGVIGSYTIEAIDNNGCDAIETGQYNCEALEIVDLALTKKLAQGQASSIAAGNNVVFQIEVTNQGNVPVKNITVIDYIPVGLTLVDPNWTAVGNNAQTTLPSILAPSSSILVSITLGSLPINQIDTIVNTAEIIQAERVNGTIINIDDDSVFDNNKNNDGVAVNNEINGVDNDEDDHDIEDIIIEPLSTCLGLPGTMPSDTVFACFDKDITVTESNSILDPNRDVSFYVLHNNNNDIPNSIIDTSLDGAFSNPGNTDCRVYYISYVFGPDSGDGTPNLSNECTISLQGTPVIWLKPITIASTSVCAEDGNNFTVNYIVNGGYPACIGSTYTVGGTIATNQINASVNISDPTNFSSGSDYTISIKDNIGCTSTSYFEPVFCTEPNVCGNNIAGMMPADTIFACAGSSVTQTAEGSVLDDLIGFYYLHNSSSDTLGTIYNKSATGEFEDRGNYCQRLYISYAIGPDNGNGEPILFDNPCATVLKGTPVVWASPIKIETRENCNNETGLFTFSYDINGGFAACFNSQYSLSGDIIIPFAEPGDNYLNSTMRPGSSTYTFSVDDGYGCSTTFASEPIVCEQIDECNNAPGTMPSQIMFACAGEPITSIERNSVRNATDVFYYALHLGNSNSLVNVINTNNSGIFIDPGTAYNCDTLYISYVFGPPDTNGQPNLASACTNILTGTPAIWAAPITINTVEDCDESIEQFTFSYTLSGGFPSCIGTNYTVRGNVSESIAIPDQIFNETTLFSDGYSYTINVEDEKGCANDFISEPIACKNPNPCNSSSTIGTIPFLQFYPCANGSVNFNIENINVTDNFVDDGDIDGYILHDGDYTDANNIISTNTDGIFNDPSRPCETLSLTYVIGPDDGTGFPNIEEACTQFSTSFPVIWFPLINISSTATCDDNTGNLIVNFNVSGGTSACSADATFKISGDYEASNLSAGNHNIPFQLTSGQPYQITATDGFDCTNTYSSEIIDCTQPDLFCGNVLGAMQFSNQMRACSGVRATAQQENTILADGSIGQYYLHTNSDNTLGSIVNNNNSGTFVDPGLDYACDTLYISYVLGPNNGNGAIDLLSDCTFVLPGAPVIWASPLIIFTNENCLDGEYKINYELSGGFPKCFTSANYNITGTITQGGLSPGNYLSESAYPSGTNYELIVTDDFGCTVNYEKTEAVNCYITTYCINNPGTAKNEAIVCWGDNVDGSVFDTIIDGGYEIVYLLHDGETSIGNIYAYSNDGVFLNNDLSILRNEQLYISSVVSILDNEGKPDFTDMCAVTMLPGTPVVFLDELQIESNIIACDTLSRTAKISYKLSGGYPSYDSDALYIITGSDIASIRFNFLKDFSTAENSYELLVSDSFGCKATFGGFTNCGNEACANELGNQPQNAVTLCDRESINAAIDNFNITDEAQLIYVLHDKENVIGEIFDSNTTGIFINNDEQYPLNTQLYVSAIIGILNADGLPNFSEPCTIANFPGTPVTFLPKITLLDDVVCDSDTDEIKVTFDITGGSGQYTITGDYTGEIMPGELGNFTLPNNTQNYTLTVTDNGNNCETLIIKATECTPNNCNTNAGSVTQFSQFLCGGESLNIIAENTQESYGYSLYYFLHDGFNSIGNVVDFNTTGSFINNGQYNYNKQYYISSVVTSTIGGNPNVDDLCLSAALPGTPVVFYEPITVTVIEEVCSVSTGNYIVQFTIDGGAPGNDSFMFYNVSGILTSDYIGPNQVVETGPQSNPNYIIVVEDDNSCNTTFEKNNVDCESNCPQFNSQNIVNIISPNGDGINDGWSAPSLNECYPNHRITICNRWGDKVSEIENCVGDCWDGTVSKNGEPLPTGAYFYIIELRGVNSAEDEIVTGSITLLR